MKLKMKCPLCKAVLDYEEFNTGRSYKCPDCSVVIWIPQDMVEKVEK